MRKIATPIGLLAAAMTLRADHRATGHASATILSPLDLREETPMDFGSLMCLRPEAGSVRLEPDSKVTHPEHIKPGGGAARAGTFRVRGLAGTEYDVALPESFQIKAEGGAYMTVTLNGAAFVNLEGKGENKGDNKGDNKGEVWMPGNVKGTLPAGGEDVIALRSSLRVAETQRPGVYRGTYEITVNHR
jgi:hypothetical protein